jgi:hypothetical protein
MHKFRILNIEFQTDIKAFKSYFPKDTNVEAALARTRTSRILYRGISKLCMDIDWSLLGSDELDWLETKLRNIMC